MLKHQLVTSQVSINDIQLLNATMTEEERNKYIERDLVGQLAELIVSEKLGTVSEVRSHNEYRTEFKLSLVVIKQEEYVKLRNAILVNDFQVMQDGEVVPLSSLL